MSFRVTVSKDEGVSLLKAFRTMAKTQFDGSIKVIRLDNSLKLRKSYEILAFFANSGITRQTSCVQTP